MVIYLQLFIATAYIFEIRQLDRAAFAMIRISVY